jgi:hypothetical protein
MVLHPSGSMLGRASNARSENKYLSFLETGEYSSTLPFSKKTFGGSNFVGHFWRENLEFLKLGF